MTKKNVIQTVFGILLILLMCMPMAGCIGNHGDKKEVLLYDPANADYSIVKEGKQLYIKFDKAPDGIGGNGSLNFYTLNELRDAVVNGKLTVEQKKIIKTFKQDKKGRIPICDFINMKLQELPQGFDVRMVNWYGDYCMIGIGSGSVTGSVTGTIVLRGEDSYKTEFQRNYTDYHEALNMTITKTETTDDNKTVTYYTTGYDDFKDVQYTLKSNGKVCHVLKVYILPSESSVLQPSENAPYAITMFCEENGTYYTIGMFELTEEVSDEWLLQFGFEKYKK